MLLTLGMVIGAGQPTPVDEIEPIFQGEVLLPDDEGVPWVTPAWESSSGPAGLYGHHRQRLPKPVGRLCRHSCLPNFRAYYFRRPYDYRQAIDYPWYPDRY
jgi:hypothetical protein